MVLKEKGVGESHLKNNVLGGARLMLVAVW